MPLLTEQELSFFRINGYIITRGAVEPELIDRCRDLVWDNIPEEAGKPETWERSFLSTYQNDDDKWVKTGDLLELVQHESLFGVTEQLLGQGKIIDPSPGSILLNFPKPDSEWIAPGKGAHLDNSCGHSLNIITILDTILPKGGGFTIWPGSHQMCYEYFTWNDVHYGFSPDEEPVKGGKGGCPPWIHGAGLEFTGEPGDVCIIHPWMIHTAGHNVQDSVRMISQNGFFRKDFDEDYNNIGDDVFWFFDGLNEHEKQMKSEGRDWKLEVAA